jgi:regulator of sirC expression with transglutaminase-like and TPR domain
MSEFNKWCAAISLAVAILNLPAYADQIDIRHEMGWQVRLPEDQIDIGIAALTFAKEIYPEIDIAAYSRRIDALADQVRRLANGTTDPERRIRVMNTVFFRMEGFHYDRDPFSRVKLEYYFLNGILDTKQGICYTMPLLYVAVAQQLSHIPC